jgi:hypothetical protein
MFPESQTHAGSLLLNRVFTCNLVATSMTVLIEARQGEGCAPQGLLELDASARSYLRWICYSRQSSDGGILATGSYRMCIRKTAIRCGRYSSGCSHDRATKLGVPMVFPRDLFSLKDGTSGRFAKTQIYRAKRGVFRAYIYGQPMKLRQKKSTIPRVVPNFSFREKRKLLRALQKCPLSLKVRATLYAISDERLGRGLKIKLRRSLRRFKK